MDLAVDVLERALDVPRSQAQSDPTRLRTAAEATSAALTESVAPQLRTFLAIQTALLLLCAAAELFSRFVLHLSGPYIYPLRTPDQTCWDFILFTNKFQHFGQPDFFLTDPGIPFSYPAPLAVAYKLFFLDHAHPLRLFLGFIVAAFLIAGALVCVALHRRGLSRLKAAAVVAATLAMAYPIWFEMKQGNIEICVWALVALGVWAFAKGRGYSAAACFGIAGSMKIFPFIYLGLLLSARRYREMAFAAVAAAVSTVVSLALVGPGILSAWRSVQEGMATFRSIYILTFRPEEIGFDHSLFGIYKRIAHPLPAPEQLGHIATAYLAVAAVAGIALYFLVIRKLPLVNQILCLTAASIVLPPISFDYTLMHLYIPLGMLALFAQSEWRAGNRPPGLTAAFVCLAILVSPESEIIHHGIHTGGQVKALTLVALLGIGLRYRFASASVQQTATATETPATSTPARRIAA